MASRNPNIIFIMADDMGWGDLGCYVSRLLGHPTLTGWQRAALCLPTPMPARICNLSTPHERWPLSKDAKKMLEW